jgi:hypothetical protein
MVFCFIRQTLYPPPRKSHLLSVLDFAQHTWVILKAYQNQDEVASETGIGLQAEQYLEAGF